MSRTLLLAALTVACSGKTALEPPRTETPDAQPPSDTPAPQPMSDIWTVIAPQPAHGREVDLCSEGLALLDGALVEHAGDGFRLVQRFDSSRATALACGDDGFVAVASHDGAATRLHVRPRTGAPFETSVLEGTEPVDSLASSGTTLIALRGCKLVTLRGTTSPSRDLPAEVCGAEVRRKLRVASSGSTLHVAVIAKLRLWEATEAGWFDATGDARLVQDGVLRGDEVLVAGSGSSVYVGRFGAPLGELVGQPFEENANAVVSCAPGASLTKCIMTADGLVAPYLIDLVARSMQHDPLWGKEASASDARPRKVAWGSDDHVFTSYGSGILARQRRDLGGRLDSWTHPLPSFEGVVMDAKRVCALLPSSQTPVGCVELGDVATASYPRIDGRPQAMTAISNSLLVGGLGFVARSTDRGRTFVVSRLTDELAMVSDFATSEAAVAGVGAGRLRVSRDLGATWSAPSARGTFYSAAAFSGARLVLGVDTGDAGTVNISDDLGATSRVVASIPAAPMSIVFGGTTGLLVTRKGTTFASADAGETWTPVAGADGLAVHALHIGDRTVFVRTAANAECTLDPASGFRPLSLPSSDGRPWFSQSGDAVYLVGSVIARANNDALIAACR